eukprot:m.41369 g.41369  ORF g.41369 m.41369 type:complete len:493 (-) comp5665_c0_seq2:2098-3576(-)
MKSKTKNNTCAQASHPVADGTHLHAVGAGNVAARVILLRERISSLLVHRSRDRRLAALRWAALALGDFAADLVGGVRAVAEAEVLVCEEREIADDDRQEEDGPEGLGAEGGVERAVVVGHVLEEEVVPGVHDAKHRQPHRGPDDHRQADNPGPVLDVDCKRDRHDEDQRDREDRAERVQVALREAVGPELASEAVGAVCYEEDDDRVDEALEQTEKELAVGEQRVFQAGLVEEREVDRVLGCDVLLEDADGNDRQGGEHDVVERDEDGVVHRLRRVRAEEGEPEVDEREGEILVEEVAQEAAQAEVRPAAVHQQQALEEPELGDREVRSEDCLTALEARDADTDMGRLDHADVVGAITDCKRDCMLAVLDQLDDLRLLKGRHAAAHHGRATRRDADEHIGDLRLPGKHVIGPLALRLAIRASNEGVADLAFVGRQREHKAAAVDDQAVRALRVVGLVGLQGGLVLVQLALDLLEGVPVDNQQRFHVRRQQAA